MVVISLSETMLRLRRGTLKLLALGESSVESEANMRRTKGFTLVELMVVVTSVAILAAVAIPILQGRIDAAKWSEGKAGSGTIATALRAYAAEKSSLGTYPPALSVLGLTPSDLHGTHFTIANYSIPACQFTKGADPEMTFTIRCDNSGTAIKTPTAVQLNQAGNWTEIP